MPWKWYRGQQPKVSTDWERDSPAHSTAPSPTSASPNSTSPNPAFSNSAAAMQAARLEALYAWERRCRGYELFAEPVALEPAYVPFIPWTTSEEGGWAQAGQARSEPQEPVCVRLLLPAEQAVTPAQLGALFSAWRGVRSPLALEIIGSEGFVGYQVACAEDDLAAVLAALRAAFPQGRMEVAHDLMLLGLVGLDNEESGNEDSERDSPKRDSPEPEDSEREDLEERDEELEEEPDGEPDEESDGEDSAPEEKEKTPGSTRCAAVDLGLYDAAYWPLRLFENFALAPQAPLLAQLGSLGEGQVAGVQLLLSPARSPWGNGLEEVVAQFDVLSPDNDFARALRSALRRKLDSPLWAVAVRLFAAMEIPPNSRDSSPMSLCRALASALPVCAEGGRGNGTGNGGATNHLFALDDRGYPQSDHFTDVVRRRTRRPGMLLSQGELAGLWHPPLPSMRHPRLLRFDPRQRPLPPYLREAPGVRLGWHDTSHDIMRGVVPDAPENSNQAMPDSVPWPDEFRNRHAYTLGATRMGKSTLLLNLIAQDMLRGGGLCLVDPHGDLAQDVLALVPPVREEDVLYLDLADADFPPSLGLLEAGEEWEKRLLVSDLLSILHRLFSSSWGDRLEHVLRHALLTLLADPQGEYGGGHSLRDIRPLLSAKPYREALLSRLGDEYGDLKSFWASEFPGYGAAGLSPVYNKLGLLMSSPLVRNIVAGNGGAGSSGEGSSGAGSGSGGGGESADGKASKSGDERCRLDMGEVMRERRILLVNLNQGLIGQDNAHFLGALLVSQIQLAAMRGLRRSRAERVPFTLYVDEFQNFVVSSFGTILSEAGKAALSLMMANQFLEQLPTGLQKAILSNVGTLVSFRVSAESGRALQEEFGGHFGAPELADLERGQAVARLGKAGDSFRLRTFAPLLPQTLGADPQSPSRIRERTRAQVCRPRVEVEAQLRAEDRRVQELIALAEGAEKREKESARENARLAKAATKGTATKANATRLAKESGGRRGGAVTEPAYASGGHHAGHPSMAGNIRVGDAIGMAPPVSAPTHLSSPAPPPMPLEMTVMEKVAEVEKEMGELAASADTSSADTSSADTSSADTSSADTSSADTSSADTSSADTSSADTSSADTSSADTSSADTSSADTSSADTSSADTSPMAEARVTPEVASLPLTNEITDAVAGVRPQSEADTFADKGLMEAGKSAPKALSRPRPAISKPAGRQSEVAPRVPLFFGLAAEEISPEEMAGRGSEGDTIEDDTIEDDGTTGDNKEAMAG